MADGPGPAPTPLSAQATGKQEFPSWIEGKDALTEADTIVGFTRPVKDPKTGRLIGTATSDIKTFVLQEFLGLPHVTKGVNAEMAARLLAAQKILYQMCRDDLNQRRLEANEPALVPPDEPSLKQFRDWLWYDQTKMDFVTIYHPGGLHESGSAVDICPSRQPFMPTRTPKGGGFVYSGEQHSGIDSKVPSGTNLKQFYIDRVWAPAYEMFDRAHRYVFGEPANSSPCPIKASKAEMLDYVRRLKNLNSAVIIYFQLAYVTGQGDPLPQDKFNANVANDVQDFVPQGAVGAQGEDLLAALNDPSKRDATLIAFRDQVIADRLLFQHAVVSGGLALEGDQIVFDARAKTRAQRDPTLGLFIMRPEVIEAMVAQGLCWGGNGWGNDGFQCDGDLMHFDLGLHFVDKGVTLRSLVAPNS